MAAPHTVRDAGLTGQRGERKRVKPCDMADRPDDLETAWARIVADLSADGSIDPTAFVDNWHDEGHFIPPIPPEIPEGTPLKRLAWAGLLSGPLALVGIALTSWSPPSFVGFSAGLATLAGFITLVWHLPDSRSDGWDDGAQV